MNISLGRNRRKRVLNSYSLLAIFAFAFIGKESGPHPEFLLCQAYGCSMGLFLKTKVLVLAVANIDFFVSTCVKTYVSECQRISSDIVS